MVGVTVETWEGAVIVVAAVCVVALIVLRQQRYRRIRFGVFLERERFNDDRDE